MAIETQISNMTYERLALTQPDRKWELWDGYPREKPGMTAAHNDLAVFLGSMLLAQLDRAAYRVRIDAGRLHRPDATYFVPDLFVVPTALVAPLLPLTETLEVYEQPLPLVVEIWSPGRAGGAGRGARDRRQWLAFPRHPRGPLPAVR